MTRKELVNKVFKMLEKSVKTENYSIARDAEKKVLAWNEKHPDEREIEFGEDPDYYWVEDGIVYRTTYTD